MRNQTFARASSLQAMGRPFAHIAQFHPELTALRRDLHAHPELGYQELYTSKRVIESLKVMGVDAVHTGIGKTGVVAVIHGQKNTTGRMIGIRADMDALPMVEQNDFAWRSSKNGLMHGCGHDGHTAMLVGAARYLCETRHFNGTAVLIFQPAEEGLAGAKAMMDDGLFERFPVQEIYALHNWPQMAPGTIGVSPGPMMAAADQISIHITGKGGHGAHPYLSIDPIVVASAMIQTIQTIVSRNVRPIDSAVISICAIQAGDLNAFSVIPGEAKLVGTVRTFSPKVQAMMQQRLHEVVAAVALSFGASATLKYEPMYPATVNTLKETEFAAQVAEALVGGANVDRHLDPSMGAEDFSFMLQAKPGAYLRLGQGGGASNCFLHNPRYDFNDDILPLGAALHASLIERGMPL